MQGKQPDGPLRRTAIRHPSLFSRTPAGEWAVRSYKGDSRVAGLPCGWSGTCESPDRIAMSLGRTAHEAEFRVRVPRRADSRLPDIHPASAMKRSPPEAFLHEQPP